jgi:hypothetical protein
MAVVEEVSALGARMEAFANHLQALLDRYREEEEKKERERRRPRYGPWRGALPPWAIGRDIPDGRVVRFPGDRQPNGAIEPEDLLRGGG